MDIREQHGRALPPVHEAWLPKEHSLHRPRHSKRQRSALVCALAFFGVPLLLFIVGVRPEAIENREPAGFPSPASGWGWFTGLGAWATDNLPLRDVAVRANNDISESVFGEAPKFEGRNNTDTPLGPAEPPSDQAPEGEGKPGAGFPAVITGRDGWMYLGYDTEGKCHPLRSMNEVIAGLRNLRAAVERSGRKFVLVVAPDKMTAAPQYLPKTYAGKDCAAGPTAEFWHRAVHELNVLDLRPKLFDASAAARQPIYFRQDSHWTYLGGLTMARALAERLRPGSTRTWRTFEGPQQSRNTDLPPLIGRTGTESASRYGVVPDDREVDRTNWTPSDFRIGMTYQSLPVEGMISEKTAVVADSFSTTAAPFLAAAFADISIRHVDNLRKDATQVADQLVPARTVVIEVVERSLASGVSPVTDPQIVATIDRVLAAHPVR